mgnify:FL=1
MSSFALRSTAIRGYLTRTLRRPGAVVGPRPMLASAVRPAAVAAGSRDKKKLVFLGTPEVAASALEAILDAAEAPDAAFEVHAVVSQPGRPRGRGRSKSGPPPPSPVAEAAMRRGIPEDMVLCPVKANEPDFLQRLRDMEPDLMITAAYGNFLPQKFLDIPRLGTLNIHPSLLPQFRGAAPVQRCLERGDAVTGVSVAYTVLKMDAGPVLRRVEHKLNGDEKHDELLPELFATGAKALIDALPSVWDGTESFDTATPQADYGDACEAPKTSPEEARMDFIGQNARTLHNKVRGFAGWPGTKAKFEVRKDGSDEGTVVEVKIITTKVVSDSEAGKEAKAANGAVELTKNSMRVPCGGGDWLEVLELQPPGKKAMKAGDYANGMKGSTLTVVSYGDDD